MDDQTEKAARPSRKKGQHGLGHIYEHRASWWLDVRIRGERHRQKIGLVKLLEKREARKIADERINELLMPKAPEPPPENGTMPFDQFAKKFVAWASGTKRSWAEYRDKKPEETPLGHAVDYFGSSPLKDITPNRVEDFRLHLLNVREGRRRLKRASANRYVSLLRRAFYWAIQNGDADKNPVAALNKKMLDEEQHPTRVLEEGEEQRKLMEAMPSWLRLMTIFCLQNEGQREAEHSPQSRRQGNSRAASAEGNQSERVRLRTDSREKDHGFADPSRMGAGGQRVRYCEDPIS
jgi:Phage integrase SAM-like domain